MVSNENGNNKSKLNMIETKKLAEARVLIIKKNYQKAIWLLNELIDVNPKMAEAYYLLGICYINEEKYLDAATVLSKATELDTSLAEYYSKLALAYIHIGSSKLAIKNFKQALELDEGNISALVGLGDIYYQEEDFSAAAELFNKVIKKKPSIIEVQKSLALTLSNLDDYVGALNYANKAIRQAPNDPDAHGICARVHMVGGNVKEAEKSYLKAIELDRSNGTYYSELISIKKIRDKNDPVIKRMEKLLQVGMPPENRSSIHFALGKAYNDSQQWDKAFENFSKGNLLIPSLYNKKIQSKFIHDTKKIFTPSFFNKYKDVGSDSLVPVFIIGMPRSGSTLIDQVLSSHSNVYSIGESKALPKVIDSVFKASSTMFPKCIKQLSIDMIASASKQYLDIIQTNSGEALRIVDKMLFNFLYLGFISILFPKAKIIHSIRNPLDTCLSNFFTNFQSNGIDEEWSNSLDNIGFFYKQYYEVMTYWQNVLPSKVLDIHYENMITDLNGQARKIIEFCELDWEQDCLEFYKTTRSVQTASVAQVRQPIYSSSVSRWLPYAKYLGPLVEQLGDIVKDDYEQLRESGCNFKVKKQGLLKKFF